MGDHNRWGLRSLDTRPWECWISCSMVGLRVGRRAGLRVGPLLDSTKHHKRPPAPLYKSAWTRDLRQRVFARSRAITFWPGRRLYCSFLSKFQKFLKGPPSTTIGGRRASQEGFWGGVPTPNPQDPAQEMHYLPEWSRPGIWPGGRIFGGECSPTTLVAVTTSYFSPRNFRQSLVLTLL